MKSKKIINTCFLILTIVVFNSCKKLIAVDTPQNQLTTDKVFADSVSATAAMVNVYALFDKTINNNYNKFMGLYTDELGYTGATQEYNDYVRSAVASLNTTNLNNWKNTYFAIYGCNDVIEQVLKSSVLSAAQITAFTNEAKFLRAYAYFYLINTYGSVPLLLQTDINKNARASAADSVTVYRQIFQDLKDAQSGLPADYIGSGRVRANKYAATALLARIYLWQHDWANAESSAASVIGSGLYTPLPAPAQAFIANSQETILSFWTQNGFVADAPSLIPGSGAPAYFFTDAQMKAFEPGDLRKSNWIKTSVVGSRTYYSPYKYRNRLSNTSSPEYLIALRTGEQYLIRSEARVQQGNITGALADLNIIRSRAGLGNYTGAADKVSVLSAILHERQTELFTEWGNRFLDLKRTGLLNPVINAYKTTWKPTATVLPIPQKEINTDPNLKQNQGY